MSGRGHAARTVGITVLIAFGTSPLVVGSAGASVMSSKKSFCKAIEKPTDITVEFLSSDPAEAEAAVNEIERLLKVKPPKNVAKALKTMRAAHQKLAGGGEVSQEEIDVFDSATDVVGSFAAANCLFS